MSLKLKKLELPAHNRISFIEETFGCTPALVINVIQPIGGGFKKHRSVFEPRERERESYISLFLPARCLLIPVFPFNIHGGIIHHDVGITSSGIAEEEVVVGRCCHVTGRKRREIEKKEGLDTVLLLSLLLHTYSTTTYATTATTTVAAVTHRFLIWSPRPTQPSSQE
ncbi:unnamed protein product [Rodentolepis nana]|uniref:Uncharacterized protein n=1 Tax=Rodentolepis nana TaxID=102285 RepID=A0A0R3TLY0_RODNA|nr:unnamed protein product [Rodentolepis nana]